MLNFSFSFRIKMYKFIFKKIQYIEGVKLKKAPS